MGTKKDMSPKITATTDQEIIKCLMDINQISHNTALNKLKCVKHLIYFSNFLDPSNYAFFYAFIPEEFRVPDEFFAIINLWNKYLQSQKYLTLNFCDKIEEEIKNTNDAKPSDYFHYYEFCNLNSFRLYVKLKWSIPEEFLTIFCHILYTIAFFYNKYKKSYSSKTKNPYHFSCREFFKMLEDNSAFSKYERESSSVFYFSKDYFCSLDDFFTTLQLYK